MLPKLAIHVDIPSTGSDESPLAHRKYLSASSVHFLVGMA